MGYKDRLPHHAVCSHYALLSMALKSPRFLSTLTPSFLVKLLLALCFYATNSQFANSLPQSNPPSKFTTQPRCAYYEYGSLESTFNKSAAYKFADAFCNQDHILETAPTPTIAPTESTLKFLDQLKSENYYGDNEPPGQERTPDDVLADIKEQELYQFSYNQSSFSQSRDNVAFKAIFEESNLPVTFPLTQQNLTELSSSPEKIWPRNPSYCPHYFETAPNRNFSIKNSDCKRIVKKILDTCLTPQPEGKERYFYQGSVLEEVK